MDSNRITELFFHLIFILLIIISYVYYLERTIPFDGAYYSFKIIFYENFNIENDRWGACYNQILPLLGVKMGFSLSTILKLYSLSFIICNYVFFLIIYYGFKQHYTAIAFVLTQLIAYRYNFYYQVSEIHAIIGPIYLLVAICLSEKFMTQQKKIGGLFILLLIFWLLNIHLLSIVIIAFCVAFLFINNKSLFGNYYLIFGILASLVYFYFKLKSIPINSYQNQKLVSFENMRYALFNLNKVHGYNYFKIAWSQNYILPSAIGTFMAIYYIYKRMILKFSLLLFSVFGLWLLLMAATINPDSPIGYENYYALFGYLIVIPFIFDFIRHINFIWYFPVFLIILALSFASIITCGNFMNHQIEFYKRASKNLNNFNERKFMLSDKSFDWDKIWVSWDLPFQSLLVSSLKSSDSAVTFFLAPDSTIYSSTIFNEANLFVGVPWMPFNFEPNKFPKHYFNLSNTVYKKVNSYQDTSFKSEYFTNDSLEITLDSKEYKFYGDIENKIAISIKNKAKRVFSSIPTYEKQILLGYHVIRKSDNKLIKEGRSAIEMDVFPNQTIISPLSIPRQFLDKGIYAVEIGIVEENKRWIVSGNWVTIIMI